MICSNVNNNLALLDCCAELTSGKSIPIHFVLDGRDREVTDACENTQHDSYVVVPGNALFSDLVHIVLARIGLSPVDALAAKGKPPFSHSA